MSAHTTSEILRRLLRAVHIIPAHTPCVECGRDTTADWEEVNEFMFAAVAGVLGIRIRFDETAKVWVGKVEGTDIMSQGRTRREAVKATAEAMRLMLRYHAMGTLMSGLMRGNAFDQPPSCTCVGELAAQVRRLTRERDALIAALRIMPAQQVVEDLAMMTLDRNETQKHLDRAMAQLRDLGAVT